VKGVEVDVERSASEALSLSRAAKAEDNEDGIKSNDGKLAVDEVESDIENMMSHEESVEASLSPNSKGVLIESDAFLAKGTKKDMKDLTWSNVNMTMVSRVFVFVAPERTCR
jgi:dihydropteroate synthase